MGLLSSGCTQYGIAKITLFLLAVLVACIGFKDTLKAQSNAAELSHSPNSVIETDSDWSDDFADMSGLLVSDNVQITAGQLTLADDALSGSAISIPISPTWGVSSWGRLYFTATVPLSTNLAVDVLDGTDTPLMHDVPSGGSLAGIDAGIHPILKLRAVLTSTETGQTPRLDEWRLSWSPNYPRKIYLPIAGKSFRFPDPLPRLQGAAIGFTGTPGESLPGKIVRFPSVRKNDTDWHSSFAIQNITAFATTLTLEFFRENGTVAYAQSSIPLRPYGTYLASLADYHSLVDGSYALAVTATEPIVGMATTRHRAGAMAVAYNATDRGGQQIVIPLLYKDYSGWTSRLCIHNIAGEIATVTIKYFEPGNVSPKFMRSINLSGNGINCTDLAQEPFLPSHFVGLATITTEDTDLAVTVNHMKSEANLASGYQGFDFSTGADISYLPRCWKENNWQTSVLVSYVGFSATEAITVSYHESDGSVSYTFTNYYPPGGLWTSFLCPDVPGDHLGSAAMSANQSQWIALVTDKYASSGTDIFSYPGISISSTTVYVPNIGAGLDHWTSTLSIQNPNPATNPITATFYNRAGDVLYELVEDLPPYGMGQHEVPQLPGLSASYEGSVTINATSPVAVLVSKEGK